MNKDDGAWMLTAAVAAVFGLALMLLIYLENNPSEFDPNDSNFQPYLSVCHNQAGIPKGQCLFAWQYPEQAKILLPR